MEPDEFRQWRKSLGWKQKDAAEKLGLKKRVIQYYEKGDRDGKAVAIPTSVELACLALALGHDAWDGEVAARAIEGRTAPTPLPDDAPLEALAALDGADGDGPSPEAQAFVEPGEASPSNDGHPHDHG
ncbi:MULTISPECIES: helix-turn-helix domain-containing protein [unclassified Aureimonas]|uniref:helix-turn-helix domain-containing protein n=1 Tax=unclassified Aureimonas TaxID=2615206 RepID=UPI0009E77A2C|nr:MULTISPECIES: helix-turn-helix transcriptional regulator [unclassified Aureimonas]